MKKGVSPLIATVLLIGFTVALAAIIMTWGQGFIKGTQKGVEETTEEQTKCLTDIDFEITCKCSNGGDATVESCSYRVINNKGSTLRRTEARFFDVNDNFIQGQAGPSNIGPYGATTTDSTITFSPTPTTGGIKIELIAKDVLSSERVILSCGAIAVSSTECSMS